MTGVEACARTYGLALWLARFSKSGRSEMAAWENWADNSASLEMVGCCICDFIVACNGSAFRFRDFPVVMSEGEVHDAEEGSGRMRARGVDEGNTLTGSSFMRGTPGSAGIVEWRRESVRVP